MVNPSSGPPDTTTVRRPQTTSPYRGNFSHRPAGYSSWVVWLFTGLVRDWKANLVALVAGWFGIPLAVLYLVLGALTGDQVTREGHRAVVTVAFDVDGVAQRLGITLAEDRGLLQRWQIENGLFPIELAADATLDSPSLAGVEVGESGRISAFPGGYEVTAADHPLFTLRSTIAIAGGAPVPVSLSLHADGERAVEGQVRSHLDGCVSQSTLDPEGCAFESSRAFYDYDSDYRDITWSMIEYPELSYAMQADDTVYVEGTGGLARVTATADSVFVDDLDEDVEVVVYGFAWVDGGAVRFEPDA